MNRIKKVKEMMVNAKARIQMLATSIALALVCQPVPVLASKGDPGTVVKAAIDVVVNIFPFIGAFFVVSGVFKLIMAYRNDQPEAQSGAAKDIVIGAVFIVFKVFAWDQISPVIF